MSESTFDAGMNILSEANSGGDNTPVADSNPAPVATPPAQTAPPATGGGHPAWQPYLKDIPEGLHGVVKPAFEQWDKSVQERLSSVQSKYDPYKQFVESRIDPNQLREAYDLYNLIQNDPRRVYDAMGTNFGYVQDQGQLDESEEFDLGEENGQQQFDITKNPQFQQLQQTQEQLVQSIQQAQAAQVERQGEEWVDGKINEATEVFRQANVSPTKETWAYVLNTAMGLGQSGMDNDQAFKSAVDSYLGLINQSRAMPTANSTAPVVLPTSGGTPSNPVPTEMSDEQRRRYGADYLRAALKDS